MKTLFLKLMAVSAGIVVGLGLLAAGFYWSTHRTKQWNPHAITTKLRKYAIFKNTDKPNEPHFYTNLTYDVTNNTPQDYTLPVEAWSKHLMEQQSESLRGTMGWDVSLAQGLTPFNLPANFFDPKPILIPSHTTVQVLFVNDTAYVLDHVAGKTNQQVAEVQFRDLDELVVLDNDERFKITFPVKGFWKGAPDQPQP